MICRKPTKKSGHQKIIRMKRASLDVGRGNVGEMIMGWSTALSSGMNEKELENARRRGGDVDSGEMDVGELG